MTPLTQLMTAPTISRPTSTWPRFSATWFWLFCLVPADAALLLDLFHGVRQPMVWVARFLPAFTVLGVVAFAQLRDSALALRLRKELHLVWPAGLGLLLVSGAPLLGSTLEPGLLRAQLAVTPWLVSGVLVPVVLLWPLASEVEHGTLGALVVSPRGAQALAEKYALGALLVVLSRAQLSSAEGLEAPHPWPQLWLLGFATHVVPLVTVPTWFFLTKRAPSALALTLMAPLAVAAGAWRLDAGPQGLFVALGAYAVLVLAALPWVLRRGALALGLSEGRDALAPLRLGRSAPPLFDALVSEQREAAVFVVLVIVAAVAQWAMGTVTQSAPLAFVLSACLAALSPGLALAEPRRLGVLEHQLTVRPRAEVLVQRAGASLGFTLAGAVVVPLVVLRLFEAPEVAAGPWLVAMGVVWALSMLVAARSSSAGMTLAAGLGLSALVLASHFALFMLGRWALGYFLQAAPGAPQLLAASCVFTALLAGGLGWWWFVRQPSAAAWWWATCFAGVAGLASAALFGAASTIA